MSGRYYSVLSRGNEMGKLGKFTTNRQQRREKFYYRPIFIPAPASTRSCWPVTNRDSSEDR